MHVDLLEMTEEAVRNALRARDPFDDYVPIIPTPAGFDVYLTDDIVDIGTYNKLLHKLSEVDETFTVRFFISTPGGSAATAEFLYHAIKNCKAHTQAVSGGLLASAGTVIALACKELDVTPTASVLIHEGAVATAGKLSDTTARQTFQNKLYKQLFSLVYGKVLTKNEISKVLRGEEFWMSGEELTARFQKGKEKGNG